MKDSKESMTSKLCSFARAYHSNYAKEKIYDDYLAYDILGKEEYDQLGSLIYHQFDTIKAKENAYFKRESIQNIITEYLAPIPLSRIKYAEGKLMEFANRNENCQYVICGAGSDTFAFRNTNDNMHIYEIDHPSTQNSKLERIRELEWTIPKNVHHVPVDFEKDDMSKCLEKAGFNKNKKTFFSILGVSYYLTLPIFEETVKNIAELSSKGNMILFDYPDETTFDIRKNVPRVSKLAEITAHLGEEMKQGFSYKSIDEILKKWGFVTIEHLTPKKIQLKYFTGRKDNLRAFENVHFISASNEK